MTVVLDDTWQVARKVHGCNACLGRIPTGERYHRQRLVWDGEMSTYKCHAICDAIYWKLYREYELFDDESVEPNQIQDGLLAVFATLSALSEGEGT